MSPPSGINGSLCLCSQEIWKALCFESRQQITTPCHIENPPTSKFIASSAAHPFTLFFLEVNVLSVKVAHLWFHVVPVVLKPRRPKLACLVFSVTSGILAIEWAEGRVRETVHRWWFILSSYVQSFSCSLSDVFNSKTPYHIWKEIGCFQWLMCDQWTVRW